MSLPKRCVQVLTPSAYGYEFFFGNRFFADDSNSDEVILDLSGPQSNDWCPYKKETWTQHRRTWRTLCGYIDGAGIDTT